METRLPTSATEAVQRCFEHAHPDERFYALVECLLWRNEAVRTHLDMREGPSEGPNASQVALAATARLDLQVPNGGLLQFFWNCPGWVDHVSESLRVMDLPALVDTFERSTAELVARIGTYSEFRKRNSLQAYSECAGEFNFEEFDSAFYRHTDQMYANSIAFVSEHLADFVL
ncbi:MAG TPA: DUF4375 domain-containing protein [Planctomycetaceae bacterium]|jgi:hypothetical protein|nr:DUF4375 domain-containing protein [Planctomycetaceae bacterium]